LSKADGITLNAGVALDQPGYVWTTNGFIFTVGQGEATIDIQGDEFQYLQIDNLHVSGEGTLGQQPVGIAAQIHKGKITPDAVSLDADGQITAPLTIGPVTLEAGSGVGGTIEENELLEIRFTQVAVSVGELGTDKTGVVKGMVSGKIDVPNTEASGDIMASVEKGFSFTKGKVTVSIKTVASCRVASRRTSSTRRRSCSPRVHRQHPAHRLQGCHRRYNGQDDGFRQPDGHPAGRLEIHWGPTRSSFSKVLRPAVRSWPMTCKRRRSI
jgi:hypothetical protein